MSRADRKFGQISGLELPEEKESLDEKDIEYGHLVLKMRGEETPFIFDVFSKKENVKLFLMEFFLEMGKELYDEYKEQNEENK